MPTQLISLIKESPTRMMGMRQSALPLREQIESTIEGGEKISIDFTGVEATQSFVDELVGVLVGAKGPSVLEFITFKGCSDSVKGIIQFVVSDRAADFLKRAH